MSRETFEQGEVVEDWVINKLCQEELNVKRINNEIDILVKKQEVEIKSTHLLLCSNENNIRQGRYIFKNKNQVSYLCKNSIDIIFVVVHDKQYIIQGVLNSKELKDLDKKESYSISEIQRRYILTYEDWLKGVKKL